MPRHAGAGAAARGQSAPSLQHDGVVVVSRPADQVPEVVVLSSDSDDEIPPETVGTKVAVTTQRKGRLLLRTKRRGGAPAPGKRRRRASPVNRGSPEAAAAAPAAQDVCGRVGVAVKQESDGGWPAEFQPLRTLPFEQSKYDELHKAFFTERDVCGGERESLTRGGTLRRTLRVTRHTTTIAEWPRLHKEVDQLIAHGQLETALGHMRCLEHYLKRVNQGPEPRVLRQCTGRGGGAAEMIDLTADKAQAQAIDVEQLEEIVLGPLPSGLREVKQEVVDPAEDFDKRFLAAVKSGDCAEVERLIDSLEVPLTDGAYEDVAAVALKLAMSNGHVEVARLLLEYGAAPDLHAANKDGWTVLHEVAWVADSHTMALLLDPDYMEWQTTSSACSVQERTEGNTPLHYAARWGATECVRLLLEAGANPEIRTNNGHRALDVAQNWEHAACAELLLNAARVSPRTW